MELMEVMEELGDPGENAEEMMHLLDSNIDGFLVQTNSVEFMRKWEDRDNEYKSLLDEKLHDLPHHDSVIQ